MNLWKTVKRQQCIASTLLITTTTTGLNNVARRLKDETAIVISASDINGDLGETVSRIVDKLRKLDKIMSAVDQIAKVITYLDRDRFCCAWEY